ncbi:MAG: hypothetical protein RIF46_01825 [Cyclobacteriaceae bacterium]
MIAGSFKIIRLFVTENLKAEVRFIETIETNVNQALIDANFEIVRIESDKLEEGVCICISVLDYNPYDNGAVKSSSEYFVTADIIFMSGILIKDYGLQRVNSTSEEELEVAIKNCNSFLENQVELIVQTLEVL